MGAFCDEAVRQNKTPKKRVMVDSLIVSSFTQLLQAFSPCFTAPTWRTFAALASGWTLNLGRHTVTGTVRSAGVVGSKHISSFHRFFSRSRWSCDEIGLVLLRLVVALLPSDATIRVVIDDTLGRHTGKKIAAASMHRDPLLSTQRNVFFHWGHRWVVMGVVIDAFDKTWCLPVLARLYRSQKLCDREKRPYLRCQQLAAELLKLLAEHLPSRKIIVLGDAEYTNSSVIRGRPSQVHLVGRGRLDAALYAPPPTYRRGQMGRPRVRGARIPSPERLAKRRRAPWQRLRLTISGRMATVQVLTIDALWYRAARSELMRLVLVRDFPGHKKDDVFVCTDPTLSAGQIIELYCKRWSLEVTFHDTKGKLGFEDPQNRSARAVERTALMALWTYSLTVLWYLGVDKRLKVTHIVLTPWYSKTTPAFSDMLAALRRASWSERLFDPGISRQTKQKLKPLLDYFDACA